MGGSESVSKKAKDGESSIVVAQPNGNNDYPSVLDGLFITLPEPPTPFAPLEESTSRKFELFQI